MSDAYEIRAVKDRAPWDAFVHTAIGGTVFSTCTWLDCATQALSGEALRIGVYKKDKLVAGLAALVEKRGLFTHLETPALTPHTGLLFAPLASKGHAKIEAERQRACELLIEHLQKNYDHLHLTHTPAFGDMRPFSWANWQVSVRYTYRMDLSDLDALWQRVERRTRTVIRKAEKLGFRLLPTNDLDLFAHLYDKIYAHQQKAPPIATAITQRFVAAVLEAGLGRAFTATSPEGDTAALVVFVEDGDTAYAWVAGADPALNNTGATSLLYWKYFEQSQQSRFDFVGANIPSIAFFKRGLGGDLVPYYATEGFGNAWLRRAMHLKRLFR